MVKIFLITMILLSIFGITGNGYALHTRDGLTLHVLQLALLIINSYLLTFWLRELFKDLTTTK